MVGAFQMLGHSIVEVQNIAKSLYYDSSHSVMSSDRVGAWFYRIVMAAESFVLD